MEKNYSGLDKPDPASPLAPCWGVYDAKNRFSELLRAAEHAPQTIQRHKQDIAVVLSMQQYRRLTRFVAMVREDMRRHSGAAPL